MLLTIQAASATKQKKSAITGGERVARPGAWPWADHSGLLPGNRLQARTASMTLYMHLRLPYDSVCSPLLTMANLSLLIYRFMWTNDDHTVQQTSCCQSSGNWY
jgi:hypothetical protein